MDGRSVISGSRSMVSARLWRPGGKDGQRVLHFLNASATENIQLALPGHQFQVVARWKSRASAAICGSA